MFHALASLSLIVISLSFSVCFYPAGSTLCKLSGSSDGGRSGGEGVLRCVSLSRGGDLGLLLSLNVSIIYSWRHGQEGFLDRLAYSNVLLFELEFDSLNYFTTDDAPWVSRSHLDLCTFFERE